MILNYITLIVIVVVLGLILAFLYIRDKEMTKSMIIVQENIDELKNKIENLHIKENNNDFSKEYKELDDKIYEIGESLIKIVRSLKNMDTKQSIHEGKISKIEEQLKLFNLSSSSNSNENKIISLFKDGKSIEEIASEERIPVGEVELIIKLANLNVE